MEVLEQVWVACEEANRQELREFVRTDEYHRIRQLVSDARQRHGLVEGATPRMSDQLILQLPSSLHEALEREAAEEGVSLDQLVLTKLAGGRTHGEGQ